MIQQEPVKFGIQFKVLITNIAIYNEEFDFPIVRDGICNCRL